MSINDSHPFLTKNKKQVAFNSKYKYKIYNNHKTNRKMDIDTVFDNYKAVGKRKIKILSVKNLNSDTNKKL